MFWVLGYSAADPQRIQERCPKDRLYFWIVQKSFAPPVEMDKQLTSSVPFLRLKEGDRVLVQKRNRGFWAFGVLWQTEEARSGLLCCRMRCRMCL